MNSEDNLTIEDILDKKYPLIELKPPVFIDGKAYIELESDYMYQNIVLGLRNIIRNRRANYGKWYLHRKVEPKKDLAPTIKSKYSLSKLMEAQK